MGVYEIKEIIKFGGERATPYRIGIFVGENKLKLKNPYPAESLGFKRFCEGLLTGKIRGKK